MCDEEDEIAMYCKLQEQSIVENFALKQYKNQMPTAAEVTDGAGKTATNQLVFMSQRTFNRICGKYL